VYSFKIDNADEWMMLPGFQHFTPVSEGQLLAIYQGQEILAPVSGYILMPLYQKQGSDGFFLVRQV
jgi:succinylglutamate desuccinylase